MRINVPAPIARILKPLLRLPADALILSSKVLAGKIADATIQDPHLTAKFYPFEPNDENIFLSKPDHTDCIKNPIGICRFLPGASGVDGSPTWKPTWHQAVPKSTR